jgi:hypothetical protein
MESTQYQEFLLSNVGISCDAKILTDPNVWIADTGTTVHSSPHEWGMQNKRKDDSGIAVGNGVTEKTSVTADIAGSICDKYGTQMQETLLTEVTLLSNGPFNLFSVGRITNKLGWLLHGDRDKFWLEKNGNKVVFDIVVQTPKGAVYCMYFKRTAEGAEVGGAMVESKMTMNCAHDVLPHHGTEREIRRMAQARNIKLIPGNLKSCEACTIGKAKQKDVPKNTNMQPPETGRLILFLDIATVKTPKGAPTISKPNWQIMVDQESQLKISDFFETKDKMVAPTLAKIKE